MTCFFEAFQKAKGVSNEMGCLKMAFVCGFFHTVFVVEAFQNVARGFGKRNVPETSKNTTCLLGVFAVSNLPILLVV